MGLSRVKGGEPAGKEVKGWIVKHKTNVCSSPGVTREGLQAPAPPTVWGPTGTHEEARAAAMAGQKHRQGLRVHSTVQRSPRAYRPRGQKKKDFEKRSGPISVLLHPSASPHSLLWGKATVICLEFPTLPSAPLSTEVSSLTS